MRSLLCSSFFLDRWSMSLRSMLQKLLKSLRCLMRTNKEASWGLKVTVLHFSFLSLASLVQFLSFHFHSHGKKNFYCFDLLRPDINSQCINMILITGKSFQPFSSVQAMHCWKLTSFAPYYRKSGFTLCSPLLLNIYVYLPTSKMFLLLGLNIWSRYIFVQ